MIRQHKKMLVFTSIVTLLPIVIGLLLWKQLPDSVATHFGADNQPNGYSSKVCCVWATIHSADDSFYLCGCNKH